MADDRVILFEVQVKNNEAIASIVAQKDAIKKLKDEQEKLDLSTEEGKTANEAYNATIKAKTAELNKDQKAVVDNTKAMNMQAGSIEANRLKLSQMTAEYIKLDNPTKAHTKAIKTLSDELKKQESAIGNNTRNVGNYKEAMGGAIASTGAFGSGVVGISTALTASPMGAFVQILSLLFQAFQKNDDIANTFKGVIAGIGVALNKASTFVVDLFKSLGMLGEKLAPFSGIIAETGNRIINALVAPIMLAINAFGAMKKALSGDVKGAMQDAGDAVKNFGKDLTLQNTETNKYIATAIDLAKSLGGIVDASVKYKLALDSIEDATNAQNLASAKLDNQLTVLQKKLKNTTLTYEEQIAILDEMEQKEKQRTATKLELLNKQIKLEQDYALQYKEGTTEREDAEHKAIDLQIQAQQIIGQSMALQEKYNSQREQFAEKESSRLENLLEKDQEYLAFKRLATDDQLEQSDEVVAKERDNSEEEVAINEEASNNMTADITANAENEASVTAATEKLKQEQIQGTYAVASGVSQLARQLAGDNFEAQKAISITEAIINTAKGVSSALSVAPPVGYVLAGVTAALGAVQVAKIASAEPPSAAAGGGEFYTTKPTMLMVGDNPGGIEKVTVTPLSGRGQTRVARNSGLIAMAGGGSLTVDSAGLSQVGNSIGSDVLAQSNISRAIADSLNGIGNPVVSVVDIKSVTKKTNVIESRAKLKA